MATGYVRREKFWTDEEILDLFPDGDISLVNPLLRRAQAAEQRLAALQSEVERQLLEARYSPLGDNHHNAAQCPYCNPKYAALQSEVERLRKVAEVAEEITRSFDGKTIAVPLSAKTPVSSRLLMRLGIASAALSPVKETP